MADASPGEDVNGGGETPKPPADSTPGRNEASKPAQKQLASPLASQDREGIALLRKIFPELTNKELYHLHKNHIQKSTREKERKEGAQPTSNLGRRIWKQSIWLEDHAAEQSTTENEPLHWRETELPDDFLRLPADVGIRRFNEKRNKWEYIVVQTLEQQVVEQHKAHLEFHGQVADFPVDEDCYTRVLYRDPDCGLGMTLCEQANKIWVHSLLGSDGSRWFVAPPPTEGGGPAQKADIHPGDWLLGINGQALIPLPSKPGGKNMLVDAVSTIRYASDPIVIHLRRVPPGRVHPLVVRGDKAMFSVHLNRASLLDTTLDSLPDESSIDVSSVFSNHENAEKTDTIHPFAKVLAEKGLIHSNEEQTACTKRMHQFTERTRQWESFVSFRLDSKTSELRPQFDPNDLPRSAEEGTFDADFIEMGKVRPFAPSTPTLNLAIDHIPTEALDKACGNDPDVSFDDESTVSDQSSLLSVDMTETGGRRRTWQNYPGQFSTTSTPTRRKKRLQKQPVNTDVIIPLMGIRKALCIRIVNTFLDGNRTAYTIWVCDIESGREWYAPMRRLKDFQELRTAVLPLCKDLAQLPFPVGGWGVFGNYEVSESENARATKCRQLEHFLRALSTLIYTHRLHPYIAEISIHLQSFLGCGTSLGNTGRDQDIQLQNHVTLNEAMCWQMPENGHNEIETKIRLLLKRAIQRYTFRLFLLDEIQRVVSRFVDQTRAKGLKPQEIEALEARGRLPLKERAMQDLERIQMFLDHLQKIILMGCIDDFESIGRRREYALIHGFMEGQKGKDYLEKVSREAVREQIEIEIYVPLRGVVSRLLVNGWRHDDMEIHFKMQELRKRPQPLFRIPTNKQSPSGWKSVSSILNEGVGMSTLPCAKLRAIVDAAREVSRVFKEEHKQEEGDEPEVDADSFLPIFIYCVVRAEMERPCALCILLKTLCEPSNRIGEIGYYLASFEAAIAYIQEIDLTVDRDLPCAKIKEGSDGQKNAT